MSALAAGAYLWFHEAVSPRTWALVVLGVVGLAPAALGSSSGLTVNLSSLACGVLTAVTIVAYTLGSTALLDRYSAVAASAFVMLIGAAAVLLGERFTSLGFRASCSWSSAPWRSPCRATCCVAYGLG